MATKINRYQVASKLEKLGEELGCDVRRQQAQTGTIYLTFEHHRISGDSFKIRVADHGDAYATADYTCDGLEGTPADARRALLDALRTSEKGLRRLRRARKAAEAREIEQAAQREAAQLLQSDGDLAGLLQWAEERAQRGSILDRTGTAKRQYARVAELIREAAHA